MWIIMSPSVRKMKRYKNKKYIYDAEYNLTLITNDSTNTQRQMYWDEDNRLMVLSDNGKTSRYTYNAGGERIMKSYGTMEGVYINGAPQGITFHETDNFTLYPASILTVSKNRFTKHYFIGSQRIASRIGTGTFNNVYGINGSYVTAGLQDYAERMNQIQSQKEAYYKELGIAPGVPTEKGAYGAPENTGVGYNTIITNLGDHSVPEGWVQTPKHNTTEGSTPGTPINWNDPSNPDDPQAGYGYIPNDTTTEETFFFHSDHLGSTSYITDDKGNITQYDAYLPYGELIVDEHSSSEDMPYKFNGKEMDEETGLYYYGARYLDPIASMWYGVDPLAETYDELGAYVYCAGNPISLSDANGESFFDPSDNQSIWSGVKSFIKGVGKSFKSTYNMVRHPVNTGRALLHAAKARWNAGLNSSDINERGEAWGETTGDIAQAVVGVGVTKATAKSTSVVVKAVKAAKTARKVNRNSIVLGSGKSTVKEFIGSVGEKEPVNFTGDIKVIKTTKDINLSRYYGGKSMAMGRYLNNGAIDVAYDRNHLAILEEWNTMTGVANIKVPKGTILMQGRAASQGTLKGGGMQYFTPSTSGFTQIK